MGSDYGFYEQRSVIVLELEDEVLLQLASALRETKGPTPNCSIEGEEELVVWETERLLFEDASGEQRVVLLEEIEPAGRDFLYACLRLWLIKGTYHHNGRAEA